MGPHEEIQIIPTEIENHEISKQSRPQSSKISEQGVCRICFSEEEN